MPRSYYLIGALVASILILSLVPKRINTIRDRLTHFSNCKRNSAKELAVLVVGDEPAALLITTYFMQRASRKLIFILYFGSCLILSILGLSKLVDQGTVSSIMARVIIGCSTVLSVVLAFAILCQGIVQALIGLDSSVGITPSPIGKTEFVTVGWIRKEKVRQFRHSEVYAAQETIDAVIEWLGSSAFIPKCG